MSIRGSSILALVLIQLQFLAAGQNPQTQNTDNDGANGARSAPAPALSGMAGLDTPAVEDDANDMSQIPALLGGKGTSLAFQSEMERSNYLRGGLNVGAAYDDNPLLTSDGGVGNTSFSVFPNLSIDQSRPRLRWTLGYASGLTVNQRFSTRNQGSHDLNFDSQFRLSPHVSLRVAEDFSMTTGFFGAGSGAGFAMGGGGSNTSLITPLAKQRTSSTVVETNYHFALKDLVGASGSFYDLHFSDAPVGTSLTNTRAVSASAFWLHEIFRRNWLGFSYRFQRVSFDPTGESRVHSILVADTLSLPGGFTLSGFFGPEYSDNHGLVQAGSTEQVSNFTDWFFAGGVDAGWQKKRTSVTAGYSKRVSDGGGVLGVVRFQNVHAGFRRELFSGWAVRFGASHGTNQSLTVAFAGSPSSINSTSVSASLERNIGRSLGLQMGYFHDFQTQSGSVDPTRNFDTNRNRFFVTLSYQWAKPLGR